MANNHTTADKARKIYVEKFGALSEVHEFETTSLKTGILVMVVTKKKPKKLFDKVLFSGGNIFRNKELVENYV